MADSYITSLPALEIHSDYLPMENLTEQERGKLHRRVYTSTISKEYKIPTTGRDLNPKDIPDSGDLRGNLYSHGVRWGVVNISVMQSFKGPDIFGSQS
jgi:hypothetical protein